MGRARRPRARARTATPRPRRGAGLKRTARVSHLRARRSVLDVVRRAPRRSPRTAVFRNVAGGPPRAPSIAARSRRCATPLQTARTPPARRGQRANAIRRGDRRQRVDAGGTQRQNGVGDAWGFGSPAERAQPRRERHELARRKSASPPAIDSSGSVSAARGCRFTSAMPMTRRETGMSVGSGPRETDADDGGRSLPNLSARASARARGGGRAAFGRRAPHRKRRPAPWQRVLRRTAIRLIGMPPAANFPAGHPTSRPARHAVAPIAVNASRAPAPTAVAHRARERQSSRSTRRTPCLRNIRGGVAARKPHLVRLRSCDAVFVPDHRRRWFHWLLDRACVAGARRSRSGHRQLLLRQAREPG